MRDRARHSYCFKSFRLDVAERQLLENDVPIPLAPRAFDVLAILVENAGHLVEKDELLSTAWQGSVVEEANIARVVHKLRRALREGETGRAKFIETVAKRGYRFVADVRRIDSEAELGPAPEDREPQTQIRAPAPIEHVESSSPVPRESVGIREASSAPAHSVPHPVSPQRRRHLAIAVAILLLAGVGIGGWLISSRRDPVAFPILTNAFNAERLSTDGKVSHAVISPNGKLVVYSHANPDDSSSVWLRNLETGHNREVIPSARDIYFGLQFSTDGDWLYFVRAPRSEAAATGVYRLSIHGGVPEKILSDTQGWIAISPDGSQIAFVRCHYKPEDNCSMYVADARTGGDDRKLVTRMRPYRIRDVDFSPDGKLLAFTAGQSEREGMDFSLWIYDLASDVERELPPEKFFNIPSIAWLPDSKSVLMAASRLPMRNYRIWRLAIDTGQVESLTRDTESYQTLSLDHSGTRLVCSRQEDDFRIRVLERNNPGDRLVLPKAGIMRFAPDGKLFYTSTASGRNEIWSVNPDGRARKQLTNNLADDTRPVPGPDGATIYFSSNRTGSGHVWRMNSDGTDQTRVTFETGGFPLAVSPDGEWVFYHHETNRSLRRVRARGGDEQAVLEIQKTWFAISPDARAAAYSENIDGESFILIVSLSTGQTTRRLKTAEPEGKITQLAWLPNGDGIAYLVAKNQFRNNTLWVHAFDSPNKPQKVTEIDQQINEGGGLAIAPDGKTYAVSQGAWLHDAVLIRGLK